jgi:hypothetical protein
MQRKGYQPTAKDMPHVVSIHNTINERSWQMLMEYEEFHAKYVPTLRNVN